MGGVAGKPAGVDVDPAHLCGANYSTFVAPTAGREAFTTDQATPQGTISTTLVTNVFPYTEPALAVRADDQALLVWNYDDTAAPAGPGL